MIVATDFDGTLTTGQLGRAMGRYLEANGDARAYKRFYRRQIPRYLLAKIGLMPMRTFKKGWARGIPFLFEGMDHDELTRMFTFAIENEIWPKRRVDVLDELAQYQAEGSRIIIVSGAYQPFLDIFAARIEVEGLGTALEMVEGRATGKLIEPLNVGDIKVQRLQQTLDGKALDMAFGDTIDDIPMLELSHSPVAVYPTRSLRRVATKKGWRILA